jgi:hypothetical protein
VTATPIPDDVTVCVTSCGRRDLMLETMASLQTFHRIKRLIISEDSTDMAMVAWLKSQFPNAVVLHGPKQLGVMGSIDRMYAAVETPYIFHIEDDWSFDGPIDFAFAKKRLAADAALSVVCVRIFTDFKAKHRARATTRTVDGVELARMDPTSHELWYGHSPNPGMLRHDLWQKYKPWARFTPDGFSGHIKGDGHYMEFLIPGVAHHIGGGRHVDDPQLPKRPKTRLGKLRREVENGLSKLGLIKRT